MEKIIQYNITDEDYEILKMDFPDSPCNACGCSFGCCGCEKQSIYSKKVQELKNKNLYEPMMYVQQVRKSMDIINKESYVLKDNYIKLRELGFSPDKIFGNKINMQ